MDARPNVLNKILPCSKRMPVHYYRTSGSYHEQNLVLGSKLDPDTDESVQYQCVIPRDFKNGSDFTIIAVWCPVIANNTGSNKVWRALPSYNYARLNGAIGAKIEAAELNFTIPDGEPAFTVRKSGIITIPNLEVGDVLGLKIARRATHADDTYAGNLWLVSTIVGMYTADKIGVT